MKHIILFLALLSSLFAQMPDSFYNRMSQSFHTRSFTASADRYDITFKADWFADDYPMTSAPARMVLRKDGAFVASLVIGFSDSTHTVLGTAELIQWDGDNFNGMILGTWHLTGLTPGEYTVDMFQYTVWNARYHATTVWVETTYMGGADPALINNTPVPDPDPETETQTPVVVVDPPVVEPPVVDPPVVEPPPPPPPALSFSGAIQVYSYDKTNRLRTRADAPYQIIYSATLNADSAPAQFGVVRAALSPFAAQASINPNAGYALTYPVATGMNQTLTANLNGVSVSRWYSLSPGITNPINEQSALLVVPAANPNSATISNVANMTVLPMPIVAVTVDSQPLVNQSFTDLAALPNVIISLNNLYPGHTTYAVLTDSFGNRWTSTTLNGATYEFGSGMVGVITVPLAEVLTRMPRSGNVVTIQIYSENSIANWRNALANGLSDASGTESLLATPITLTIDLRGTASFNLSTL